MTAINPRHPPAMEVDIDVDEGRRPGLAEAVLQDHVVGIECGFQDHRRTLKSGRHRRRRPGRATGNLEFKNDPP